MCVCNTTVCTYVCSYAYGNVCMGACAWQSMNWYVLYTRPSCQLLNNLKGDIAIHMHARNRHLKDT